MQGSISKYDGSAGTKVIIKPFLSIITVISLNKFSNKECYIVRVIKKTNLNALLIPLF